MIALAAMLASAPMLAGCGGEPSTLGGQTAAAPSVGISPGAATGTSSTEIKSRPVDLNEAERKAVEIAVAGMTSPQGNSRLGPLKAARGPGSDGGGGRLQVCGYAAYADSTGAAQPMTRFYVEFKSEGDGPPEAIRGQIATTPANGSKIAFVCAKHGLS